MDPELEQNKDPFEVTDEEFNQSAVGQSVQRLKELAGEENQQEVADQQEAAELVDPREKEKWDAKAVGKELQSVLTGGIQDTASSVLTFPERTADMFSGEMSREIEEKGNY